MTATKCACSNCDWTGPVSGLGKQLAEMHHAISFCSPGEEAPAGECPVCGSCVYLVASGPTRRIEVVWTDEDIRTQIASMLELDEPETIPADADAELPAFCGEVLDTLLRRHDASQGINWDVIGTTIEMRDAWPALEDRLRAKFAPEKGAPENPS